jgi:DNA polymerase-3 subunit gamma/tau
VAAAGRQADPVQPAEASAQPTATRAEAAKAAFFGGKPEAAVDAARPAAADSTPAVADAEVKAAAAAHPAPAAESRTPARASATSKPAPAASDDIFKQYWKTQGTPR